MSIISEFITIAKDCEHANDMFRTVLYKYQLN